MSDELAIKSEERKPIHIQGVENFHAEGNRIVSDEWSAMRMRRSLTLLLRILAATIAGLPLLLLWIGAACAWRWPGARLGDLVDWVGRDER